MKTGCLIPLMLVMAVGCREKDIVIDSESKPFYIMVEPPTTGQPYLMALLPPINAMYIHGNHLRDQNVWLRETLNYCLAKLERQQGLEPYPPALPDIYAPYPADTNAVGQMETSFTPYENSQEMSLPDDVDDVSLVRASMALHAYAMAAVDEMTRRWIENFEERINRIDPNAASSRE